MDSDLIFVPSAPLPQEDLELVLHSVGSGWAHLQGKTVFFTGAGGFFGSWLLETFLHVNRELSLSSKAIVLVRDPAKFKGHLPHLSNNNCVEMLQGDARTFRFPSGVVNYVIHSLTADHEEVTAFYQSATLRLLDLATEKQAAGFLLCSTGAVYAPKNPSSPFCENDPLTEQKETYGWARRFAEGLCLERFASTQLPVKIARGFAFVGPRLPHTGSFAMENFFRQALAGQTIIVRGDGTPIRSYLYAADLAIWLWKVLLEGQPGDVYNVGSEHSRDIASVATAVSGLASQPCKVRIESQPAPGAASSYYIPDTSHARQALGLTETVQFSESLQRTWQWCLTDGSL